MIPTFNPNEMKTEMTTSQPYIHSKLKVEYDIHSELTIRQDTDTIFLEGVQIIELREFLIQLNLGK